MYFWMNRATSSHGWGNAARSYPFLLVLTVSSPTRNYSGNPSMVFFLLNQRFPILGKPLIEAIVSSDAETVNPRTYELSPSSAKFNTNSSNVCSSNPWRHLKYAIHPTSWNIWHAFWWLCSFSMDKGSWRTRGPPILSLVPGLRSCSVNVIITGKEKQSAEKWGGRWRSGV